MNALQRRFQDALRSLPQPGGNGYHTSILGVANLGAMAGVSADELKALIRQYTPPGGRRVPDQEIQDAVMKAVSECGRCVNIKSWSPRTSTQDRNVDAEGFMSTCLANAEGIGEGDIHEASPVKIEWPPENDAQELLSWLYYPRDILFIGDRFGTQVKYAYEWLADFKAGHTIPPHIIPNPLSGAFAMTKDGRPSKRADACVKSFRFAVAEFDHLSREDQLRFWWSVNLPVCALIDSGGKSLHAWIKITGVNSTDTWTCLVEEKLFRLYLVPLGCDSACRNEARLSRMPGHFRSERGRFQRVLYLSPEGRRIGK